MRNLGLLDDLIEDGALAVSELATNTHLHARHNSSGGGAELWVWVAIRPTPQLVVSVFDADRGTMPRPGVAGLLDEHGKGLTIVEYLATAWGSHPSRSRLAPIPHSGKRVWFELSLPHPWPVPQRPISPALASKRLADLLGIRGIATTRACDDKGVSLVTAGHLNIWVEPTAFVWSDGNGGQVRHPLLDLQNAAEEIIATIEEAEHQPPHQPDGRHMVSPRTARNRRLS